MKTRRRGNPLIRKEEILNAAIELSLKIGYQKITREAVAIEAGTSEALVTKYFQSMENLKCEVVQTAIKRKIVSIMLQHFGLQSEINPELQKQLISIIKQY